MEPEGNYFVIQVIWWVAELSQEGSPWKYPLVVSEVCYSFIGFCFFPQGKEYVLSTSCKSYNARSKTVLSCLFNKCHQQWDWSIPWCIKAVLKSEQSWQDLRIIPLPDFHIGINNQWCKLKKAKLDLYTRATILRWFETSNYFWDNNASIWCFLCIIGVYL